MRYDDSGQNYTLNMLYRTLTKSLQEENPKAVLLFYWTNAASHESTWARQVPSIFSAGEIRSDCKFTFRFKDRILLIMWKYPTYSSVISDVLQSLLIRSHFMDIHYITLIVLGRKSLCFSHVLLGTFDEIGKLTPKTLRKDFPLYCEKIGRQVDILQTTSHFIRPGSY